MALRNEVLARPQVPPLGWNRMSGKGFTCGASSLGDAGTTRNEASNVRVVEVWKEERANVIDGACWEPKKHLWVVRNVFTTSRHGSFQSDNVGLCRR